MLQFSKNRSAFPASGDPAKLGVRMSLKRSTTPNIIDDNKFEESPRIKGEISKILKSVNLERQLYSKRQKTKIGNLRKILSDFSPQF